MSFQPRAGCLLALVFVLPFSVSASVQAARGKQPFARIAYLKSGCADNLSWILAADVAGRHREVITRPERCRRFRDDELPRQDSSPAWSPDGKSLAYVRNTRKQGVYVWTRG